MIKIYEFLKKNKTDIAIIVCVIFVISFLFSKCSTAPYKVQRTTALPKIVVAGYNVCGIIEAGSIKIRGRQNGLFFPNETMLRGAIYTFIASGDTIVIRDFGDNKSLIEPSDVVTRFCNGQDYLDEETEKVKNLTNLVPEEILLQNDYVIVKRRNLTEVIFTRQKIKFNSSLGIIRDENIDKEIETYSKILNMVVSEYNNFNNKTSQVESVLNELQIIEQKRQQEQQLMEKWQQFEQGQEKKIVFGNKLDDTYRILTKGTVEAIGSIKILQNTNFALEQYREEAIRRAKNEVIEKLKSISNNDANVIILITYTRVIEVALNPEYVTERVLISETAGSSNSHGSSSKSGISLILLGGGSASSKEESSSSNKSNQWMVERCAGYSAHVEIGFVVATKKH